MALPPHRTEAHDRSNAMSAWGGLMSLYNKLTYPLCTVYTQVGLLKASRR